MKERINLVIFGATGFTGKAAVEEVNRISKTDVDITWAIAGRSHSKLDKVIKDLQDKTGDDLSAIPIIIADINDEDSLRDMAKQADVIINCCGPYRFYGEPVVKACVESKTNHVDISGEPEYMERMQLKYNEAAQEAGVYVVSACGMDSIPADLGVVFLQQNFNGQVNSVESYLRLFSVGDGKNSDRTIFNYGTWESLIHGIAGQKELGPLRRQLYPVPLPKFSPQLIKRSMHRSEFDNSWCLPFPGSDRAVVLRSQRFFYDCYKQRPVQMHGYAAFPSLSIALSVSTYGMFVASLTMFPLGRQMLLKYPKQFSYGIFSHEGPSEESRKNARCSITIVGKGWDEKENDVDGKPTTKTMTVRVSCSDPAYGAATTALVLSAITILKEADKMPGSGGVLSPGAAFSKTSLIENLQKNDMKFEVIGVKPLLSHL